MRSAVFDLWLERLKEWQFTTFPGETPESVFAHLKEEIAELEGDLTNPRELADCLMLVLGLCFRVGVDPIDALDEKDAINRSREWKIDPERGYAKHV